MKISDLMPMINCKDLNEFMITMITKLAKRADRLEEVVMHQQDTIDAQEDILMSFKNRARIEDSGLIYIDSVFSTDRDYRMIKHFIEEVDHDTV